MPKLTIYYGRLFEVTHQIPGQTAIPEPGREPLREAIESATTVERYGHRWVLGNLEIDEDAGLVTGRLGYPETERTTQEDYDPAEHEFVSKEFELPNAASAPFVLDYRIGAIAFEGDATIGPTGFINHLVALLNRAGRGKFGGELIRVAADYRAFLQSVELVTSVAFDVRPTNPRDRAIFRPLDEGMKAANAKRQRVVIENTEDGLVVDPPESRDDETKNPAVQGIEMVEEGYGQSYRIDGERDGESLRFDSRGGGLLRDVVEDAPEDAESRTQILRGRLSERADMVEPGRSPAEPLEAEEDDTEGDGSGDDNETWPEEP